MKKKLLCLLITFTMVLPCFTAIGYAEEPDYVISGEGIMPFKDVKSGVWYYDAMIFCYANGIIKGQGNEYTFAPNVELSRATFTVMLARILKADLSEYENQSRFNDCPIGSWYTASVEWAADNGYVMGTNVEGNVFSPNAIISREQCSTMLYRVIDKMGIDTNVPEDVMDSYVDKNDISDWAFDGASLMVHKGIMQGGMKRDFMPKTAMTRAQIAVVTENVLKTIVYGDCEHEYAEADCTIGKSCTLCGLLISLPNGHYCESLSCKEGGVCITCGEEVAADALLHKYSSANCTTPQKCSVCGETRGKALGHKFNAATCTAPKTCSVCKATEGAALGHTTKFGICTRCNGEVFASKFLRAAYYMVEKAEPDGKGVYSDYAYFVDDEGGIESGVLYYDANVTKFGLGFTYVWSDDYLIVIGMEISQNTKTYKYQIGYYDPNHNLLAESTGYVDAPTLKYSVSSHGGSSQYWSWVDSLTVALVESSVAYGDYLLNDLCGEDTSIFGF
ncbi:MAG: S-layer homology domain-containing protein [Ruminococcaceae bacterium]|nr:S-layer homology domain-containing protein [Oscillospiraceae bacterium]